MKKKKALWIYAALAIGGAMWFAGCEAMMELLGFGSAEEASEDQNPPDGGGNPVVLKAESPFADPGAGSAYTTAPNVTLTTGTDGAVIYYTVDGDDPTAEDGAKYDAPVTVSPGATLKAVAVKDGWTGSDIMAITYMDATAFTFSPDTGTITAYTGSATDLVIFGAIDGTPVTVIGKGAFQKKQLESVTIPDSVTTIGILAFAANSLTGVTIGNAVTSIENGAFIGNSLTNVTIPDSVTSIKSSAFYSNPLTSVTMPANVATVDGGAFPGDLGTVYNADKATGMYTRASTDATEWAKSGQ